MARLDYTQPPESLAEELREVAGHARALQEALRRSNGLPDAFPAQQFDELLTGLQALVDGTAEGCREPLTYARARLPQIRREYILTEARSAGAKVEGDQVPPLMRGETIDNALSALMTSVSTALDEYRRLAGESGLDEVDTSSSQTLDQDAPDVRSAIKAASLAEKQLGATKDEVEKLVKRESAKGDELKRQLTDARGLYRLARIELRMPQFVPEWLKRTAAAARNYPGLLRITSRAIHVGVDVAESMNKVWSRLQDRITSASFDTMRDAADELLKLADKWEKKDNSQEGEVSHDTQPVDFDLAQVRADILAGRDPKPEWRPWVIDLDLSNTDIVDLTPLRNLNSLQTLVLSSTDVSDLKPIETLVNLRSLNLLGTRVTDINPITQLSNLQFLSLKNTNIKDISAIGRLRNLQMLDISNTDIAEINALEELHNIEVLDLSFTSVIDIHNIRNMFSLRNLDITGTAIKDIEPVHQLSNLEFLDLGNTKLVDINPLRKIFNLRSLNISNTELSDINPLINITNLESLYMSKTNIVDISPLEKLVNIRNLTLSNTLVFDITPLKYLVNMHFLDLKSSAVVDISPLKCNINLKYLIVADTSIESVEALNGLESIQGIYVDQNRQAALARTFDRKGVVKGWK